MGLSARESLIVVLRCERTSKVQARVVERVREGKCLGTTRDGLQCDGKPTRVGLCSKCHNQWMAAQRHMDESERAAYRQRLVACGRMLGDREVIRIKNQSVFNRLA
jgi:ribosomal protein L31